MSQTQDCEYCGRPVKDEPVIKVLKGEKHHFCSGFCFRLFFYDAPRISYDDLQKMYSFYCVSVPVQDFQNTLKELTIEEDR
ncbi:MAG: hypothetical protein JW882_00800 [Deltaproteobacteria bacterium]|nr:hypothetical protein [Deltaproteobacteria bacterium]